MATYRFDTHRTLSSHSSTKICTIAWSHRIPGPWRHHAFAERFPGLLPRRNLSHSGMSIMAEDIFPPLAPWSNKPFIHYSYNTRSINTLSHMPYRPRVLPAAPGIDPPCVISLAWQRAVRGADATLRASLADVRRGSPCEARPGGLCGIRPSESGNPRWGMGGAAAGLPHATAGRRVRTKRLLLERAFDQSRHLSWANRLARSRLRRAEPSCSLFVLFMKPAAVGLC